MAGAIKVAPRTHGLQGTTNLPGKGRATRIAGRVCSGGVWRPGEHAEK